MCKAVKLNLFILIHLLKNKTKRVDRMNTFLTTCHIKKNFYLFLYNKYNIYFLTLIYIVLINKLMEKKQNW